MNIEDIMLILASVVFGAFLGATGDALNTKYECALNGKVRIGGTTITCTIVKEN